MKKLIKFYTKKFSFKSKSTILAIVLSLIPVFLALIFAALDEYKTAFAAKFAYSFVMALCMTLNVIIFSGDIEKFNEEYKTNTIKYIVSKGYNQQQCLTAYLVFYAIYASIVFILQHILTLLPFIFFYKGTDKIFWECLSNVLYVNIQCFFFTIFLSLISLTLNFIIKSKIFQTILKIILFFPFSFVVFSYSGFLPMVNQTNNGLISNSVGINNPNASILIKIKEYFSAILVFYSKIFPVKPPLYNYNYLSNMIYGCSIGILYISLVLAFFYLLLKNKEV